MSLPFPNDSKWLDPSLPMNQASDFNTIDAIWMFTGPLFAFPFAIRGYYVAKSLIAKGYYNQYGRQPGALAVVLSLPFLAYASFLIYTIHQIEEHGWDFYGRRYYFIEYFNLNMAGGEGNFQMIMNNRASEILPPVKSLLTPRLITMINSIGNWAGFSLGAELGNWVKKRNPSYPLSVCFFSAIMNWGLIACNGVFAHGVQAVVLKRYNPGVASSVALLIPLGLYVLFRFTFQEFGRNVKAVMLVLFCFLIWGLVLCHGVLVGSLSLVSHGHMTELQMVGVLLGLTAFGNIVLGWYVMMNRLLMMHSGFCVSKAGKQA